MLGNWNIAEEFITNATVLIKTPVKVATTTRFIDSKMLGASRFLAEILQRITPDQITQWPTCGRLLKSVYTLYIL